MRESPNRAAGGAGLDPDLIPPDQKEHRDPLLSHRLRAGVRGRRADAAKVRHDDIAFYTFDPRD
jgi:hypothetical protein